MSVCYYPVLICSSILVVTLFFAGCTTIGIGEAGYANDTISLPITNTGGPSEGYVQVTVYEIKNNQQEERDVLYAPLSLKQGENTALISGILKPGQYKLYIYLIQNGERKAAAIRDIMVN
jgi:hypothetical protein